MTHPTDASRPAPHWTFLTNHSHVLLCLARDPGATLREVADTVGITERAVQRIVRELEQVGVLTRRRQGRRNSYEVNADFHLRHPLEAHRTIRHLLALLDPEDEARHAPPPHTADSAG